MTETAPAIPDLPGVLKEIAEGVGLGVALELAGALGGSMVYIAREPTGESQVVKAVGLEAARDIGRLLGGDTFLIPLGPLADARRQRAAIAKRLGEGQGVQRIARDLHCHCRTVQRVKNRQEDRRQADLFHRPSEAD